MSENVVRRLETPKKVKGMTDAYYKGLLEARERGRKVAWCIGPVPFAPLHAMDIGFVHVENYGARLAARGVAPLLHRVAEDWGLSKQACSYLRGCQGMSMCFAQGIPMPPPVEPLRLGRPDFVICLNYCVSAINMAEVFRRELKVPVHVIDARYHYSDEEKVNMETYVPYQKERTKAYISFLEEQTGRRMNYDTLSEVISNLKDMARERIAVTNLARNVPSPITGFDLLIALGVGNILAGTPEALQFFKELRAEVQNRVDNKISAVPNERYRLLWELIAIWPKLGYLSELLARHGASIVFMLYTLVVQGGNPDLLDPSDPVASLARDVAYSMSFKHGNERARVLARAATEFKVDGLIGHLPRTCRKESVMVPFYMQEVSQKTAIPLLTFEADHSDPDFYSPAEVETRILAFLEMLEAGKQRAERKSS